MRKLIPLDQNSLVKISGHRGDNELELGKAQTGRAQESKQETKRMKSRATGTGWEEGSHIITRETLQDLVPSWREKTGSKMAVTFVLHKNSLFWNYLNMELIRYALS